MPSDPIVARYRQRLTELSPEAFEQFVGDLWAREGWETDVTQARADRGIDVKATRGGMAQQTALIQAKRYRGDTKVEPADVREYAGVRQRERDADMMILVTTGAATSGAREEATELNVELIEGDELARRIADGGHGELVDEYNPESTLRALLTETRQAAYSQSPTALLRLAGGLWLLGVVMVYGVSSGATGAPEVLQAVGLLGGWLVTPYAIYLDSRKNQGSGVGAALVWAVLAVAFAPVLYLFWMYRR